MSGKPLSFKTADGRAFDPFKSGSTLTRTRMFLKKSPRGVVFTRDDLTSVINCTPRQLSDYNPDLTKDGLALKFNGRVMYGSVQTMKDLAHAIDG